MSSNAKTSFARAAGQFIERASDRIGVLLLLAMGVATATATVFVGS
jgi:hypothetical protein